MRSTKPSAVGELLVFPSVQECENGETLSWIDGDPASEYPAPRLLILAPGSEPATSIDQVPADAPGRELLTGIIREFWKKGSKDNYDKKRA